MLLIAQIRWMRIIGSIVHYYCPNARPHFAKWNAASKSLFADSLLEPLKPLSNLETRRQAPTLFPRLWLQLVAEGAIVECRCKWQNYALVSPRTD